MTSIKDNSALLEKVLTDTEGIMSEYACKNKDALREYGSKYDNELIRTQYAVDTDKILHSVMYNRGNDKTQVFSFYRNDDITRRSIHVQLVSRIARIIGRALRLNIDLIEAIAIGHDIGHTPFGHKGEEFLNKLYFNSTKRYFNHNVHSVRVLQKISKCNLTLQTLDGIICHCGEKAFEKYQPVPITNFAHYNAVVEECYTQKDKVKSLIPATLEGCVVRISDIIAYLGKDRQDAFKVRMNNKYKHKNFGSNSAIITTIITDIISNSMGQPYIALSKEVFDEIKKTLDDNNTIIYQCEELVKPYTEIIEPMMQKMYEVFLKDVKGKNHSSIIFKHFLATPIIRNFYKNVDNNDPNDIVVDFIASMTDDYFIDAFKYLFPDNNLVSKIKYIEYFDERYMKYVL